MEERERERESLSLLVVLTWLALLICFLRPAKAIVANCICHLAVDGPTKHNQLTSIYHLQHNRKRIRILETTAMIVIIIINETHEFEGMIIRIEFGVRMLASSAAAIDYSTPPFLLFKLPPPSLPPSLPTSILLSMLWSSYKKLSNRYAVDADLEQSAKLTQTHTHTHTNTHILTNTHEASPTTFDRGS